MHAQRGFTIAELVIVMVIVGVLSAVLANDPSSLACMSSVKPPAGPMSSVRQRSRNSAVGAVLKTISIRLSRRYALSSPDSPRP